MDHEPKYWLLLEIVHDQGKSRNLLAGWYNLSTSVFDWILSSDIKDIHYNEFYFDIDTKSGSTYRCYKSRQTTFEKVITEIDQVTKPTKINLNIKSKKQIKL